MGAWGTGIFDNDGAADFASDVSSGGGLARIEATLDRILASSTDYLDGSEAEEGLAAAEIVARLNGRPGEATAYSKSADEWIKGAGIAASSGLTDKARRAVARILAPPSEIVDLWSESNEGEDWRRNVENLLSRL